MGQVRSKLVKGTSYIFISTIIGFLVAIVHSIIVARLLKSPELLGVLSIYSNVQNVVMTIAIFSIPIGITKFTAEYSIDNEKNLTEMLSTSLIMMLLLASFSSVFYFILSSTIAEKLYYTPVLGLLLKIGAISIVFSALSSFGSAVLRGFHEMKSLAYIGIINGVLSLPITFFFILKMDLVGAVLALLATAIISFSVVFKAFHEVFAKRNLKLKFTFNWELFKTLTRFVIPLFLVFFFLPLALLFVNTQLALTSGFEDVGLYKIAFNIHNLFLIIPATIAVPLLPIATELYVKNQKVSSVTTIKIMRILLLFMLPLVIFGMVTSKFIISLLYGDVYTGAWLITYLMLIEVLIASLYPVASSIIMGAGKTWKIFQFEFAYVLVFIPSAYFLIGLYGLTGLGLTHILSTIVEVSIVFLYLRMKFDVRFNSLFLPAIVTIISICLVYGIMQVAQGTTLLLFDGIIVSCLLVIEYFIITDEEKKMIIRSIKEALHIR